MTVARYLNKEDCLQIRAVNLGMKDQRKSLYQNYRVEVSPCISQDHLCLQISTEF